MGGGKFRADWSNLGRFSGWGRLGLGALWVDGAARGWGGGCLGWAGAAGPGLGGGTL